MKKTICFLFLTLLIVSLQASFYKYLWNTGRTIDVSGEKVEHANNILSVSQGKNLYVYSMFDIYNFTLNGAYSFQEEIQDIEILTSKDVIVSVNSILTSKRDIDSLITRGRKIDVKAYNGNQVAQDGTLLYLAHGDNGLTIYDIGTNLDNVVVSNYHKDWGLNTLAVKWPLVYVGNKHGIASVNLTNISHPMPFGQDYSIFEVSDIEIYNDILFAVSSRSLNVIDISLPGKMNKQDVLYFPYPIRDIKIHGNELYVILGQGGLEIYRINSDNSIENVNSYNDGNYLYDISFYQDYIFMLSKDKKLRIFQYR